MHRTVGLGVRHKEERRCEDGNCVHSLHVGTSSASSCSCHCQASAEAKRHATSGFAAWDADTSLPPASVNGSVRSKIELFESLATMRSPVHPSGGVASREGCVRHARGQVPGGVSHPNIEIFERRPAGDLDPRAAARRCLGEAARSHKVADLRRAIDEGVRAGLISAELSEARMTLRKEARDVPAGSPTTYSQRVRQQLEAAIGSRSPPELWRAIKAADPLTFDDDITELARTTLAEALQAVRQALVDARQADDEKTLADALERAVASHLDEKFILPAQSKLQRLVRVREARDALDAALRQRDHRTLLAAYHRANMVQLSDDIISNARQTLASIADEISKTLEEAVAAGDEHSLVSALQSAELASLDREQVESARVVLKQLREIREAQDALCRAVDSRSVASLRMALSTADKMRFQEELLRPARLTLAVEILQVAKQAVVCKPTRRSNGALRAAIEQAEVQDVELGQLDLARQALRRGEETEIESVLECCVCMEGSDDEELIIVPCCGRETSTNRICKQCWSRVRRCPLCRSARRTRLR